MTKYFIHKLRKWNVTYDGEITGIVVAGPFVDGLGDEYEEEFPMVRETRDLNIDYIIITVLAETLQEAYNEAVIYINSGEMSDRGEDDDE